MGPISLHFLGLVSVASIDIFLGVLVLFRAPRSRYRIYFFLFTVALACWSMALALFSITTNTQLALFFARNIFIWGALIPFSFYCFAKTFPQVEAILKAKESWMVGIPPILFLGLLFGTNLFVKAVDTSLPQVNDRILFGFPPVLLLYSIYYVSYVLIAIEIVWKKRKTLQGIERLQSTYALQGFFLFTVLAGISNIVMPLFKVYNMVLYGPYFTLLFVGPITYAILKYRLMNIEVALKRSLIYAMVIGIIIFGYLFIILTVDAVFHTGIVTNNAALLILVLAVIFTAVTFSSLEEWFQRVTDRIFFKGKYDYRQFLRYLEKTVAGIIELDKLLGQVSVILQRTIKVDAVFFYVLDRGTSTYIYKNQLIDPETKSPLQGSNVLVSYLQKTRKILVLHEIRAKAAQRPELKELVEECSRLGAHVCIPLMSREVLLGILCLGEKLSGDIYTAEDIVLFDTFDSQLGTAIENAYLHRESLENEKQIYESHRLATIGTMTAGIAHEIKNPMVALKTFTELLPRKFDDPHYRQKYMEIVPKEVDRINDLLESLLNLSRPAALQTRVIDIGDIVQEVVLLLKNKMEEHNVIFRQEGATSAKVQADRSQVSQVCLNLMLNAIQFMPHGGVLTVDLQLTYDSAVLRFKDTGVGIPPENIPRLFDPFFTTRHEGTGLGLAITKKIIEEHHGQLSVESKVGKGTTFTVRFPLV